MTNGSGQGFNVPGTQSEGEHYIDRDDKMTSSRFEYRQTPAPTAERSDPLENEARFLTPPVGPPTRIYNVSGEAGIDPRLLDQSVISNRLTLIPCEWYWAYHAHWSESISRNVDVNPLRKTLRSHILPIHTYDDRMALDQNWESIKTKSREIYKNIEQTDKQLLEQTDEHLLEQGCLGRHPTHIPDASSMDNPKIKARKNLVDTRKDLSLYLHTLQCPLCRPRLPMDFKRWEERYPISVMVEAVLNIRDASYAELLHYSFCVFKSMCLPGSNYEYQPFARTLFPLLVKEFRPDTLAGKSACIDIAEYYAQRGKFKRAAKILKQIFGQDFGFVLWLAQLKAHACVVLDRPGWNQKQRFNFGPYWRFEIIPRILYDTAVAILQRIRDHDTRFWNGMLAEEPSNVLLNDCFLQRLKHGFDLNKMD